MSGTLIPPLERYTKHPVVFTEASYITIYDFERNYDVLGWQAWVTKNWTVSIGVSAFYFLAIYVLQSWMRDRKPYKLTKTLVTWNLLLAIFSLVVFLRTSPEFFRVILSKNGLHNSVCNWTETHNYATAFWSTQFILSKIYELFDTAFILLRKQKLIFLHCYHHAMTHIMSCVLAVLYEPHQLWYIVMNSFIHAFMYSYYGFRAAGYKVPRRLAMALTTMQILQMIIGVSVNVYGFIMYQGNASQCPRSSFGLKISGAVAFSYLALFAQFFYRAYMLPNKSSHMPQVNTNGVFSSQDSHTTKKFN